MKIIPLSCPNCGAELELKEKRDFIFCEYCGTKLFVDDEIKRVEITKNINKTKRTINDADIIRAKNEDNKNKRDHRETVITFIAMLACFGIGFAIYLFSDVIPNMSGKIQVGTKSQDLVGENYEYFEKKLESAGFTNIEAEPIDDLIFGFLAQEWDVKEISIKGKSIFCKYVPKSKFYTSLPLRKF